MRSLAYKCLLDYAAHQTCAHLSIGVCIFEPAATIAVAGEIPTDGWAFAFILGISPCLEWLASAQCTRFRGGIPAPGRARPRPVAGPVFVEILPAGSRPIQATTRAVARQSRVAGSCLSTVRRPLPQTRQASFTGPDVRLGSFRDLGASSRASAARTQASFRLRQRLARTP